MLDERPEQLKPMTPIKLLWHILNHYYGIIKDKEVRHNINVLCDCLQKKFTKQPLRKNKSTIGKDEKIFLAVFGQKYEELLGEQYAYTVEPADINLIKTLIGKLNGQGTEIKDYLFWVFDDFYQDDFNKKIIPSIKVVCGNRIYHAYLLKNGGKVKRNKKELNKKQREELIIEQVKQKLKSTRDMRYEELLDQFDNGVIEADILEQRFIELNEEIKA